MPDNQGPDDKRIHTLIADMAALFGPEAALREDVDRRVPQRRWDASDPVENLALEPDVRIGALEAALKVASGNGLDDVLMRLVDGARTVVQASSAALTIPDESGKVQHIIVASAHGSSGPEVRMHSPNHCVLSTVLSPGEPLLVPDIAALPQYAELPPGHKPGTSLIGVSIPLGDHQQGNLFLTGRVSGEPFTAADVAAVQLLTHYAAPTIERAAMYQSIQEGQDGQERVEDQLAQVRTILNTLPAGVFVVFPPDARVEFCNQTALDIIFGTNASGRGLPVVRRDFNWLNVEDRELPRSAHPGMRALRGETLGNRALTLQTAGGRNIPVRVQSTPVRNASGDVVSAVVMFLDVSRERAAEQVKDDFLSLISHEFRTPLTAIHGGAHLLSQQGDAMDLMMQRELLQDIGEESSRLDRMLRNLLSVSEIMAGRFQASTEPILVAPLVQPLLDEFRRRAPTHGFTLDQEPDVPPAEGDPELLVQILRNLYENAVKYSPAGGDIQTMITRNAGWVSIQVRDSGLGIAEEHVPHVFERFRRPGAEPTVRGMGLGLYLSRLLVDAQGGRIQAASPGPGKGATFMVELPMVPDWEHETARNDQLEHAP